MKYSDFVRKLNEEQKSIGQVQEPKQKVSDCGDLQLNLSVIYKNSILCNKELADILEKFKKEFQKELPESDDIKVGNIYLYTNKNDVKYPVRILSLTNKIEMKGGVPFYKGDVEENIGAGEVFAQQPSVSSNSTDSAIITGKNSHSFTIKKERLTKIEPGSNYDWFNMNVVQLSKVVKEFKNKKYINVFIKTLRNLTTKFDDPNATLKNLLNFDYFNTKKEKTVKQVPAVVKTDRNTKVVKTDRNTKVGKTDVQNSGETDTGQEIEKIDNN